MKWISEVSIRNASCHLLKIKWKIVQRPKTCIVRGMEREAQVQLTLMY